MKLFIKGCLGVAVAATVHAETGTGHYPRTCGPPRCREGFEMEYVYSTVKGDWNTHNQNAISNGCQMASITNPEEQRLALETIAQYNVGYPGEENTQNFIWIGGLWAKPLVDGLPSQRPTASGTPCMGCPYGRTSATWKWSDGSRFYYQNFLTGDPNNFDAENWAGNGTTPNQSRIYINISTERGGTWDDGYAYELLNALYSCCVPVACDYY